MHFDTLNGFVSVTISVMLSAILEAATGLLGVQKQYASLGMASPFLYDRVHNIDGPTFHAAAF